MTELTSANPTISLTGLVKYIHMVVPASILTTRFRSSTVLEPENTSSPYSGLRDMIT